MHKSGLQGHNCLCSKVLDKAGCILYSFSFPWSLERDILYFLYFILTFKFLELCLLVLWGWFETGSTTVAQARLILNSSAVCNTLYGNTCGHHLASQYYGFNIWICIFTLYNVHISNINLEISKASHWWPTPMITASRK